MTFEKCPYCGAWRLKKEMVNHIGACSLYQINKMEKPQLTRGGGFAPPMVEEAAGSGLDSENPTAQ